MVQASAARVQQGKNNAEMVGEKGGDHASPAKAQQQQIGGDDWRQNERQMDDPVDEGLARKLPARQHESRENAERQRAERGDDGNSQREKDRRPFRSQEVEHCYIT